VALIPAGMAGGLAMGMQIVGRRYADSEVPAASAAFERIRPWRDTYRALRGRCRLLTGPNAAVRPGNLPGSVADSRFKGQVGAGADCAGGLAGEPDWHDQPPAGEWCAGGSGAARSRRTPDGAATSEHLRLDPPLLRPRPRAAGAGGSGAAGPVRIYMVDPDGPAHVERYRIEYQEAALENPERMRREVLTPCWRRRGGSQTTRHRPGSRLEVVPGQLPGPALRRGDRPHHPQPGQAHAGRGDRPGPQGDPAGAPHAASGLPVLAACRPVGLMTPQPDTQDPFNQLGEPGSTRCCRCDAQLRGDAHVIQEGLHPEAASSE
jgi:hypothetical protein